MRTYTSLQSLIKYSTLSALTYAAPLYAVERPTPAQQPIEAIENDVAENTKHIPYLGIFGEPISDALANQLNLAPNIGIELKIIAPNSPASLAGLKKHDIIVSLAGNDITSQNDIKAAISDKKPSDQIEVKYISKGNALTKIITLGNKPVLNARNNAKFPNEGLNLKRKAELLDLGLPQNFLDKFPEKDREKLLKLYQGRLQGLDLQELQRGLGKFEGFDFNLAPQGLDPRMNQGLKFEGQFQSRIKMVDQHGSITLKSTENGKVIELLDKAGKIQYRGPYNNEADKQSVPPELRKRVENLDIEDGLGFLAKPKMRNFDLGIDQMRQQMEQLRKRAAIPDLEREFNQQLPKDLKEKLNLRLQIPEIHKMKNGNNFELKFGNNIFSTTQTDPTTGNRYTYKKEDGKSQVEVYDPEGKLLYNGPYNSEIEKASIPEQYRDYLEKLNKEAPLNLFQKGN